MIPTATPTRSPLLSFDSLSVVQTISRVLKIVCSQWITFGQLAAAVLVPSFLVLVGTIFTSYDLILQVMKELEKEEQEKDQIDPLELFKILLESFGAFAVIFIVGCLLKLVATITGRAAMIRATAELYANGTMPESMLCLRKSFWQFCELFVAGIALSGIFILVVSVPIFLMANDWYILGLFLFLVLPFVLLYLWIRLSLAYPAIVVEGLGGIRGINRSWELTEGAFCDLWCSNLLISVLFAMVNYVAFKMIEFAAVHAESAVVFLAILVISLPSFFFTPCWAVLHTVNYMNRRVCKEGLNQGMLARSMNGGPAIEASTMVEPLLLGEQQVQIITTEEQTVLPEAMETEQTKVTTVVDETGNEIV